MTAIQKFTLTLILICFGFTSQAQLRHFPNGLTATFVYQDAFVKCSYDSINASVSRFTGDSVHRLWDTKLLRCPNPSLDFEALLSIPYLSFDYDMGRLVVREAGNTLIDIPSNCVLGQKTLPVQGKSYQYVRKDWYQSTGIQDSAAYFYPLVAGKIDYTAQPFILGFHVGWIQLGNQKFQQYSAVINGIAQNMPAITWQTFYPERAGDVKVWKYSYSFFNERGRDRGRIDSFIQVAIYADSIVGTLSRSILQYDYSWSIPELIPFQITGQAVIHHALQDSNIGDVITSGATGAVHHNYLIQNETEKYFLFSLVNEGFNFYATPCDLSQTADIFTQDDWDSRFGYSYDDYYGYSYETKQLVAARVGPNSFGNLHVLAINPSEINAPNVYPNPSTNTLFIDGNNEGMHYSIFNFQGLEICEGECQSGTISVSQIPNGIYFLHLVNGSQVYRTKIQVQH